MDVCCVHVRERFDERREANWINLRFHLACLAFGKTFDFIGNYYFLLFDFLTQQQQFSLHISSSASIGLLRMNGKKFTFSLSQASLCHSTLCASIIYLKYRVAIVDWIIRQFAWQMKCSRTNEWKYLLFFSSCLRKMELTSLSTLRIEFESMVSWTIKSFRISTLDRRTQTEEKSLELMKHRWDCLLFEWRLTSLCCVFSSKNIDSLRIQFEIEVNEMEIRQTIKVKRFSLVAIY